MKFICPSCKAKYQIADEKIAARAVRMKCRKCTEILEIGKQGAKLSVPPPAAAPGSAHRPAAGVAKPSVPRAAPLPRSSPLTASRPLGAPRPGVAAPRPPSAAAGEVPHKQPSAAALLLQRARSEIRTRPSTPHAMAPVRAPSPSPAPAAPVAAKSPPEPVKIQQGPEPKEASPGALAGAFSAAVAEPTVEDHAVEEWFVGINGVPVGPIRLSELRSKAASGAVNAESLVWRDGFEEWKALSTFPELMAIVEESRSSAHAIPVPFKPPAEEAAESAAAVTVPASQVAVRVPDSHPQVEVESQAELEALAGLRKGPGLSGPQLFAMIVAVAFGLTVGFVIFSGSVETREVVKYVEVEKERKEKAAAPEKTTPEETSDEEESEEQDPAKKGQGKGTKSKVAKAEPKEGLKGLSGLSGLAAGPQSPSGNSGSQTRSGKPLDSAAVQSTVSRYTSSVKRSCWQPALDTRDNNAPTSARVSVTITVAANGNVQNVTTSGDPRGYRGLASCIARRVRSWQFPASSGQTTVNVPFVFAAQ